ncbi:MAG TPA: ParB/RepB/Spo0J family partition protein [Candidatus Limnocylindrales bacterium]|nr:ParB/RepB/Spo0J family partition protein [Candidatus Limnocylindrales bacterium]
MTIGSERRGALGRGLASLIPQRPPDGSGPVELPLARLETNPRQPRRRIDEAALETLAASIREHGVIQPILVTQTFDGYRVVAGERRVRAARLAGLERIPAVVRQLADREQLEVALVENVQRADLDPIEEANAYRQLIDEFGLSQEEVAARVGRARSTVANTLRLLELPPAVQAAVADGRITEGHARAMAGLDEDRQLRLVELVATRGLSVRQVEELARRLRDRPAESAPTPDGATPGLPAPEVDRIEEELRRALGTKVTLARTRRGGRIVIEFYSDEELGRLYDRLVGGVA